jgi:DeoR family transcriptional regulator of aga operon
MVNASEQVVAVCDSSKFNRRSLSLIAKISDVNHVITDSNLPPAEATAIRDAGVQLTLV